MRVLICGDRNWDNIEAVDSVISILPSNAVVIHGACRGADSIAGEVAELYNLKVEEYPADWDEYGRAAGPIRNRQMLKEGKPDVVIAFHEDLSKSKGTKDMVNAAKKAGIPTVVRNR